MGTKSGAGSGLGKALRNGAKAKRKGGSFRKEMLRQAQAKGCSRCEMLWALTLNLTKRGR